MLPSHVCVFSLNETGSFPSSFKMQERSAKQKNMKVEKISFTDLL